MSDEKDINQDELNLTSIFKKTLDKHAPMRPMSRKEKRLNEKPWITRGILTSIKTKNRLFKKYYKSNTAVFPKNTITAKFSIFMFLHF